MMTETSKFSIYGMISSLGPKDGLLLQLECELHATAEFPSTWRRPVFVVVVVVVVFGSSMIQCGPLTEDSLG